MNSIYVVDFYCSAQEITIDHLQELVKQLGSVKAVAASLNVDERDIYGCLEWNIGSWQKLYWKLPETIELILTPSAKTVINKGVSHAHPLPLGKCGTCPMSDEGHFGKGCRACPDLYAEWEKAKSGRTVG